MKVKNTDNFVSLTEYLFILDILTLNEMTTTLQNILNFAGVR